MKKIILVLLGLTIGLKGIAKDDLLHIANDKTFTANTFRGFPPGGWRNNPYEVKSRLCWIPGTVLAGSGGILFLFSGIFSGIATERDPVKAAELRQQQHTRMAIGAGMMLSSIPLFILGRHYHKKGREETVLHFKLEPVNGYKGQSISVAAVGIHVGL